MGPVPAGLLPELAGLLAARLERRVTLCEPVPLPARAHDRERAQYRADSVLVELGGLASPDADRLVGIIDADCYFPGLNFIFGQAVGGGREALVALPRLRQSFYGLPEDEELFRQRVLTEIVHELGHTRRLEHCSDETCAMYFSNSLGDTDRKAARFCASCEGLRKFS